ncbi:Aste57867_8825 [Aphanomyces stellatus]|uniref:chitinase n=1 Tax=Aphanomyces stellatus TaxID=120398 RepID=A0A485KLD1_9STRA|nr:hypothetical protein As57867_008790 [Aphanomyces stellatus]VFT85711.1 Aste57867_8825 [Aphanomyces stellatus]
MNVIRLVLVCVVTSLVAPATMRSVPAVQAKPPPRSVGAPPLVTRLPKHPLVGYWHNFENPSGKTFPLSQVSPTWDVIVVAFAESLGGGSLGLTLDPAAGSEDHFIADIAALKAARKTIVLSLGGEKGSVSLQDATETANFVDSLHGLIQKYGFDGIDLDLENHVSVGGPIVPNLIAGVKQLKQRVGPSFYLSMAPEHPYVQGGFGQWGGIWGSYLPIIDGLRDELTQLHVQYYNNNGLTYPDGRYFKEGTVDGLVGGSLMLLEGFKAQWGHGFDFKPLRPDQVSIGVPSGRSSAGQGFVTQDVLSRTLSCLTRVVGCDSVVPKKPYDDFRGVMAWSINWDRHDKFAFSTPTRTLLDLLNRNAPLPTLPPTPAPQPTRAPPATVAPPVYCGGCGNCYFAPTKACFAGWSQAQCGSIAAFTWCGDTD